MNSDTQTWNRFCSAMDRVRKEQQKIERKNEKLRAKADEAVRIALAAWRAR